MYKPEYFMNLLPTNTPVSPSLLRYCTVTKLGRWALPSVLKLEEKSQEHVIGMLIYLYTGEYTIPNLKNLQNKIDTQRKCDHYKSIHSCLNHNCYLSPYAFVVSLFYLGDKYNIPGLKAYSVTRLQELLDLDALKYREHAMTVWEFAYQHTRSTDELRKLLIEYISKTLMGPRGRSLRWAPGLHEFIDYVPEMADALLKGCLKRMKPEQRTHNGLDDSIDHVPEKAGALLKGCLKRMDHE